MVRPSMYAPWNTLFGSKPPFSRSRVTSLTQPAPLCLTCDIAQLSSDGNPNQGRVYANLQTVYSHRPNAGDLRQCSSDRLNLRPINLTNGWRVTGTITTDGTTGVLAPANILSWDLKVVQTTDMVWTEKDSTALNISGVSTDGNKIFVNTSPDGIQDGGTLFFSRGGGGGQIGTNAVICDFTQLSYNLGYGMGGIAGWQDELGGLNYVGLNQRNHFRYRAASLLAGQPNVFRVNVPTLGTNPLLMTMFGTITTDGTVGALAPQNLLA
jgi:hypothetical protein